MRGRGRARGAAPESSGNLQSNTGSDHHYDRQLQYASYPVSKADLAIKIASWYISIRASITAWRAREIFSVERELRVSAVLGTIKLDKADRQRRPCQYRLGVKSPRCGPFGQIRGAVSSNLATDILLVFFPFA